MKTFLRAVLGLAAVTMTASIARAVAYIGDTQSIMSQSQYSGGSYGYVWTQLVSPSGKTYQDTTYLPTTTATGTHYGSKAFDEVGTWHFQQWSRMTQASQNIKNQDQIITVVAKTCVIAVNVAPANYGTVSGGGTVNIGASVTLSATAAAGGYKFRSWTINASQDAGGTVVSSAGAQTTSSTCTFTASANATYYANFAAPVYRTLTVTVVGSGSVTPPSGTKSLDGTTLYPTATNGTGYSFASWGGALAGSANSPALLMDADKAITATFNVNYYNVAIATNGTGSGSVPGAGYYAYGTTPSFTATPAAGSYFAGWSGAASGGTNPVGVYIDGNKSLTATFNAYVYTVSTATNPTGLTTVSGNGSYTYNQTATFTAPAVTGYTFTGWSGAGLSGTMNPVSLTVTGNAAVTANYTLNNYTLTTGVSGNGSVSAGGTYPYGSVRQITATPGTGQHFTGWSGAVTGTANPVSVTIDASKTLTASFAPNAYTVSTNSAGSGNVVGGGSYNYGQTATLTATAGAGHTFTGWSGALSGTTNPSSLLVDGDKAVTATFTVNTYAVTAATSPAGLGTVAGAGSYTYGQTATLTAPGVTGYTFTGWSGAGLSGTNNPAAVLVDANKSVTANYALRNFTLTTNASGAGGVTAGGSYLYGTVRAITATPATGQHFTGWSGAVAGTANPVSVTVDADKTVTANFAPNMHTVTTKCLGTGSVHGGGSYAYGQTATLAATPGTGYSFGGWSGDLSGTTNPAALPVNGDKAVTATFTANTYTVSTATSPAGLATVTGGGSCTYGSSVTLTAPTVTGYTFVGWSGAVTGSRNPETLVVDGNKSVTAGYSLNRYTLTTAVVGSGSVTSGGEYTHGTVRSLTATPGAKQRFTGWSGAVSGTANPIEITMDGPKTVTATFVPNVADVSVASATVLYDGKPKALQVTTTPAGLSYSIAYEGVSGNPVAVGEYRATATVDDANYQGSASGTLRIEPATPKLQWSSPAAITYPAALSSTQLNATADVPGSFAYAPGEGTVLTPGPAQELSVVFTPADSHNYLRVSSRNRIDVNPAAQQVAVSPAASSVPAGTKIAFTATGGANGYSWGGAASGTGSAQTVAFPLPGNFEVSAFSPAGGVYAQSNTATAQVKVSAVPQVVALTPATALVEPQHGLTIAASGGRNGYVWGGAANGSGDAKNLSFATPGTYGVTAYSPAGGAFLQSNTATAQVTVAFAQTINFPAPGSFVLRSVGTNLVATASSGLPVSFTVVSGPGVLTDLRFLKFTALGAIVVQADQAGDQNYSAAPSVRQTVFVNTPPDTVLQFPGKTGLIHAEHQDTNLALPQTK